MKRVRSFVAIRVGDGACAGEIMRDLWLELLIAGLIAFEIVITIGQMLAVKVGEVLNHFYRPCSCTLIQRDGSPMESEKPPAFTSKFWSINFDFSISI
jgi:hypothetical protein